MKSLIALAALLLNLSAAAHSPLFDCFDNGDGTATCEGAFSDGGPAAGVGVRVELASGRVLVQGQLDEASSYTFDIPDEEYSVYFEAGEGHELVLFGDEIY
jgi:hypothetical protein